MKMTMKQYLQNPAGKGSSIIPNSAATKQKYLEEFNLLKENIVANWVKQGDILICHLKIPSAKNSRILYDVVYEFDTKDQVDFDGRNIDGVNVRMFSNCPSFLFTYAYVFYQNELGIKWLKSKLQSQFLKKPASQRNNYGIISYEKSIYIGFLYIRYTNMNLTSLKASIPPAKRLNDIKNDVKTSNDIMAHYAEIKAEEKAAKEEAKSSPVIQKTSIPKQPKPTKKPTGGIKTKSTHFTGKVKSSSNTKKSKKI